MITGTIAICTRNRARVLRQCLASLSTQVGAPGPLEVLVVDNGSTDDTPDLLRTWAAAGEGRRWWREPAVGLSHARNAALEVSDADVVLFTDDDALTPPTWARAHLAAYADEGVGSTGGPVGLTWPAGRPAWLGQGVEQWYSALDLGDRAVPFPTEHGPYGTNMAVRRRAAVAVGGYDPALGRAGGRLLSGEEPDLTRRLRAAGWQVAYVPEAAVVQQVLPERLDRRWLLRRGFAQGLTNARLDRRRHRRPWRDDVTAAASEVRTARDLLGGRRQAGRDELADTVLALVHAGAAVDRVRSLVAGRGRA